MRQDAQENMELRRYLLRELTEEETLRVEARLFLEDKYLQQLQAAEDDLVDEYVYEELSEEERARFETHFLLDRERRKDVVIAGALKEFTSSEYAPSPTAETRARDLTPPRQTLRTLIRTWRPAVRLAFATAVVVVAVGGLWLIFKNRNQAPPLQAQLPTPQGGKINPEPLGRENGIDRQSGNSNAQDTQGSQNAARNGREQSINDNGTASSVNINQPRRGGEKAIPRQQKSIFALLIPVGAVRDSGVGLNKVTLPADAGDVRLQLALLGEDNGRRYEAILLAGDDRNIKTWKGLRAIRAKSGRVVSISVPARLLDQRNYTIALRGTTPSGEVRDISTYPFQVQK
jgi:hypothetical protein